MERRTTWMRVVVVGFALAATLACRSSRPRPIRPGEPDPKAAAAATQRGDWRVAAERWWAVWISSPEGDLHACIEAAHALMEVGDAESAGNLLDQGLLKFPKDPDLLEWKGRSLEKLGFRRAAAEYFERTLAQEPNRSSALLGLGRVRVSLSLESSAVDPLRRFVAQTGGDAESYALLAIALRGSGDTSGAYQAWQRSFEMGQPRVEDLLSASSLALDPDVRNAHPDAPATSRRWLERALSMDPMCTRAHFQLGLLSHELGAYDDAVEHYRRAVETDPSCLMALTNLAILYSGAGKEAETREIVGRALQLEKDADRRRALDRLLDSFKKGALPGDEVKSDGPKPDSAKPDSAKPDSAKSKPENGSAEPQ